MQDWITKHIGTAHSNSQRSPPRSADYGDHSSAPRTKTEPVTQTRFPPSTPGGILCEKAQGFARFQNSTSHLHEAIIAICNLCHANHKRTTSTKAANSNMKAAIPMEIQAWITNHSHSSALFTAQLSQLSSLHCAALFTAQLSQLSFLHNSALFTAQLSSLLSSLHCSALSQFSSLTTQLSHISALSQLSSLTSQLSSLHSSALSQLSSLTSQLPSQLSSLHSSALFTAQLSHGSALSRLSSLTAELSHSSFFQLFKIRKAEFRLLNFL